MSTQADELTALEQRLDSMVDRDVAAQAQDIDAPDVEYRPRFNEYIEARKKAKRDLSQASQLFTTDAQPGTDGSREEEIRYLFNQLKQFLLEKNRRYGDSALSPVTVFSKSPASDALLVRIDDKISRIKNADIVRKNDVVDLVGYLGLYMIHRGWSNLDELID